MTRVAVAFDIDHTLAIDNKLERVAFLRLLERVVDEGGAPLGTLADETVHVDALLAHQRAGACTIDEAVRAFVSERGAVADETYVRLYRAMALEMVDELVVPLPYAPQTIEALRERGCVTAVLSNGWNPLQERKARRAGFPGPVLASGDLGVQKPDGRAFAALVELLA
ncbi:MAG: HAD family hydrolase, partial [Vulcanimicrobiaceae bacterium]